MILGFVKLTLDTNQSRGFEEGGHTQVLMLPYYVGWEWMGLSTYGPLCHDVLNLQSMVLKR